MIVLDASAAVEWLLGRPGAPSVEVLLAEHQNLEAPQLLIPEVAQAIRVANLGGDVSDARSAEAILDLGDLGVSLHDHEVLLAASWELRHNVTAYDAMYVALAVLLEVPLVTLDRRLQRAVSGTVEVIVPG